MKKRLSTQERMARVFPVLLCVVMLIGSAAFPTSVRADSTITVNTLLDNTTSGDGWCTLREAITNANANSDTTGGDCAAGSGADTITFDGSLGTATITLASPLPKIAYGSGLTIDGGNRITLSGNDSVQVFYVNSSALLTLQNISVTHGSATDGGGLFNYGTVTIIHSVFSNNSATRGGGVASNNGNATVTIANSTFSNNSANYGGGLTNRSGTATLLNSTFSGNSATVLGGGVSTWNGSGTAPTTTIRNTILANSISGGDCWNHNAGSAVLIGGNNIIETTSTCNSLATLTNDPNLGSLTGSPAYFPLNAGSPAINTGDDAICEAKPVNNESQNGVTRPGGAHCDIGSYEFVVDTTAPTVLSAMRANADPTSAVTVNFTVTFSEFVTGVDVSDFTLTTTGGISGASVTAVIGGPTIYAVTVNTGSGDGTLRLDVPVSATITDLASNPLTGLPFTGGQAYTAVARVYILSLPLILR